jgi:outer membrane autotransporter protein
MMNYLQQMFTGRRFFCYSTNQKIKQLFSNQVKKTAKENNMKLFTTVIAAACILASVSTGNAQPGRPGPYVSGFLGATMPKDSVILTETNGGIIDETINFDTGIYTGATGGYDFGYVRLEGELSYKHNSMSGIKDNNSPSTSYRNIEGDVGVFATMFNAFIDLSNDSPITPYFGGGIGFANIYISDTDATVNGIRQPLYDSDSDTVFAYQAGAGVEIALRPRYSLDIGYRYFATDKAKFNNSFNPTNGLKMESHNVAVGFRFKF